MVESQGRFDVRRYLGIGDLIDAFDGKWGDALMEMLVDLVLSQWVPNYVIEQYNRWHPYIRDCVKKEHGKDASEKEKQERLQKERQSRGAQAQMTKRN